MRTALQWLSYGGEIEDVIREMTVPVYYGPGGVAVMVVEPAQIGPGPKAN